MERGLVADIFQEDSNGEESEPDDNKLSFDQVCHKMQGTFKARKIIH